MENKIEEKISNLEKAIVLAKKDRAAKEYVDYGKRIIECIRENDYSGARFVYNKLCFAFQDARVKPTDKSIVEYWDTTLELIMVLSR